MDETLEPCLRPTEFIESAAPAVVELAGSLRAPDPKATAVALFDWVRDRIRYDPWDAAGDRSSFRATATLARGHGYCVQKAVLLAALGRAAGIPTRLGFADVINHQSPPHLRAVMGTNLYLFHGYVEFLLDRWVKAAPAFDAGASRKIGVLPVTLDGSNDAMLHPVDPAGHPFIEYVRSHGTFADLPFDVIRKAMIETYGDRRPER